MTVTEICHHISATKYIKENKSAAFLTSKFLVDVANKSETDYMIDRSETADQNENDDAFYVLNINQVIKCYKLWIELFPNIRPFYAVKANNDPLLLSMFASFGMGFDCASKEEICQIIELGVSPDDIVFANPCKLLSHIRYAREKGVAKMTFDSEGELHKIASEYIDAKLLVRLEAGDPNSPLDGGKFGCSVSEAYAMLKTAKELKLNVIGVCYHVGWASKDPENFRRAMVASHEVINYASSLGYHLTVLDIGGGYPGCEGDIDHVQKISNVVNTSIAQLFSDRKDLTIAAEPGQFFADKLFSLIAHVSTKKVSQNKKMSYYINDGIFGTFLNDYMLSLSMKIRALKTSEESGVTYYPSIIWGPTCAGIDKVCETSLPELKPGDWIVCIDKGAYSLSCCTTFNGFQRPKIHYFITV